MYPSLFFGEPSRAELYGFKNRAKPSLILFPPSFFETEIRAMILNFKIFIGIIMVPRNFYLKAFYGCQENQFYQVSTDIQLNMMRSLYLYSKLT